MPSTPAPAAASTLALLLALCAVACGGPPAPWTVDVAVSPTPATVGTARVLVRIAGPDGAPAPGLEVEVVARDPDGAEGRATPAEPAGREGGVYVAPAVPLPRPGDWTLVVGVRGPAGASMEREAALHVVGPLTGGLAP